MDTDEKPKLVDAAAVPFLVPCFVQPNTFHPLALFSDGRPPVGSEYSLYAWEESTLVDVRLRRSAGDRLFSSCSSC
jgi:hypothetical protein